MRVSDVPQWLRFGYRLWRAHGMSTSVAYGRYLVTAGRNDGWEWWLKDAVPEQGRVAVDAGASFGQWSAFLAQRFETVHAFEPHPASAQRLQRRCPENVILQPTALWSEPCTLEMVEYPDARVNRVTGHDLMYVIGQGNGHRRLVPATALDTYHVLGLDFLKIDVEGAEAEVLNGAWGTILRWRPTMVVEIHSREARRRVEEMLYLADYEWEVRHFPFYSPDDPVYNERIWFVARGGSA